MAFTAVRAPYSSVDPLSNDVRLTRLLAVPRIAVVFPFDKFDKTCASVHY